MLSKLPNLYPVCPPLEHDTVPDNHIMNETHHRHLLTALLDSAHHRANQIIPSDSRDPVMKHIPPSPSVVTRSLIISHNPVVNILSGSSTTCTVQALGGDVHLPSDPPAVLASPISVDTEAYPTGDDPRPTSASQIFQTTSMDGSLSEFPPIKSFSQPQSPEFRSRRGSFPLSPCRLPMKKRKLDWSQLEKSNEPSSAPCSSSGFSFSSRDLQISCKRDSPDPRTHDIPQAYNLPTLQVGRVPTHHHMFVQGRSLGVESLPDGSNSNSPVSNAVIPSSETLLSSVTNGLAKLSNTPISDTSVLRDTLENLVSSVVRPPKIQQPSVIPTLSKISSNHSNVTVVVRAINTADNPSSSQFHRLNNRNSVPPPPSHPHTFTNATLAPPPLTNSNTISSHFTVANNGSETISSRCSKQQVTTAHQLSTLLRDQPVFEGCNQFIIRDRLNGLGTSPASLLLGTSSNNGGNIPNLSPKGGGAGEANLPSDQRFKVNSPVRTARGRSVSTLANSSGIRSGPKHNNWMEPKTYSWRFSNQNQSSPQWTNHSLSIPLVDFSGASTKRPPLPKSESPTTPVANDLNDTAQILMLLSPSDAISRSHSSVGNCYQISTELSKRPLLDSVVQRQEQPSSRMPLILVSASSSAGAEALAAAAALATGAPASSLVPVPVKLTAYEPSQPSEHSLIPGDDAHANGQHLLISLSATTLGTGASSKDKKPPIPFLFNESAVPVAGSTLGMVVSHAASVHPATAISVPPNVAAK